MNAPSVVDVELAATRLRGERFVAWARLVFCSINLLRLAALVAAGVSGPSLVARAWLSGPLNLAAVALSLHIVRRYREPPMPRWLPWVSVAFDVVVCTVLLLQNTLFAGPGFVGSFALPDVGVLVVMVIAAAFRLSAAVTVFAALLSCLGAAALLVADRLLLPDVRYNASSVLVFLISLGAASALAVATARRSRSLAVAAAAATLRAERTREGLSLLLQEQHEARSVLSAALLRADLLARDPRRGDGPALASRLRDDLAALEQMSRTLRESGFREWVRVEPPVAVDVGAVAGRAVAAARALHAGVSFTVDVEPGLAAGVRGGDAALFRALLPLVLNACEGDGARAAASVWLRGARAGERVDVIVDDDGPGIPALVLADGGGCATTKGKGSGLGLFLARGLVSASSGTLTLEARDGGGARVRLSLPSA